jgi:hypothetical protein
MITRSLVINVLLSALIIIAGTLWVFKREVGIVEDIHVLYLSDHYTASF